MDASSGTASRWFLWLGISLSAQLTAITSLAFLAMARPAAFGFEMSSAPRYLLVSTLVPAVTFAPIIGPTVDNLPKRMVLASSAFVTWLVSALTFVLIVKTRFAFPWYLALACIVVATTICLTTCDALLPAASRQGRAAISYVVGIASVFAALGAIFGFSILIFDRPPLRFLFDWLPEKLQVPIGRLYLMSWEERVPLGFCMAATYSAISGVAALFARFPGHERPSWSPAGSLVRFLSGAFQVVRHREAGTALLIRAIIHGLILAGAFLTFVNLADLHFWKAQDGVSAFLWVGLGALAGCCMAGCQGHPRRLLGLIPLAATGVGILYLWELRNQGAVPVWLALGVLGGLLHVPAHANYLKNVPADSPGNGVALANAASCLFAMILFFGFSSLSSLAPFIQMLIFGACLVSGVALAWSFFFRQSLEQILEVLIWPLYRIRAHGPGVHEIPAHGPLLVVANHTAWMDPIWVAKVIPRRIIPLMTSRFYDRPVLRWIMIHVVQAIRVPMSRFKRETPEITEAINRLDRGDCVVIFPEGFMRRSEDKPLRHFGRGVWQILHERPQTPVVVCWIEGGWGSYFSYCKGPPTKNKRLDFWRRISIAVGEPQLLNPSLLADQRATRRHLMQLCLDARRYLGLEPLGKVESIKEELAEGDAV